MLNKANRLKARWIRAQFYGELTNHKIKFKDIPALKVLFNKSVVYVRIPLSWVNQTILEVYALVVREGYNLKNLKIKHSFDK